MSDHHLEPAARRLADAAAQPPFPYELGPAGVRARLDDAQATAALRPAVARPAVDERWVLVPAGVGDVRARIVTPPGAPTPLPAVLYLHGGGWVAGSAATHDRLVRELAVGARAAVVFVEFDRAPEAPYPVALEQAYAVARWVVRQGSGAGLDGSRLAVAGDSTGATLAAALTLLAKRRGDVAFAHQSLYSPVTDAAQDTDSYWEFADGPYLTARAMAWAWDAYLPERAARYDVTMSPLRATLDDLAGLPEALVLTAENDVVRDEGEAYARRLAAAGVRTTSVRVNGTVHDFLVLDALRATAATTAALDLATSALRRALGTTPVPRPSAGPPTGPGA